MWINKQIPESELQYLKLGDAEVQQTDLFALFCDTVFFHIEVCTRYKSACASNDHTDQSLNLVADPHIHWTQPDSRQLVQIFVKDCCTQNAGERRAGYCVPMCPCFTNGNTLSGKSEQSFCVEVDNTGNVIDIHTATSRKSPRTMCRIRDPY